MSSVFSDIRSAFMTALTTYCTANNIPIADENKVYQPVQGTLYVKPYMLPAPTQQSELGDIGNNMSKGIFQINVYSPTDQGPGDALDVANDLQTVFQRGSTLAFGATSDIRLMSVSIAPGLQDPRDQSWWILPVSVRYYGLTPR